MSSNSRQMAPSSISNRPRPSLPKPRNMRLVLVVLVLLSWQVGSSAPFGRPVRTMSSLLQRTGISNRKITDNHNVPSHVLSLRGGSFSDDDNESDDAWNGDNDETKSIYTQNSDTMPSAPATVADDDMNNRFFADPSAPDAKEDDAEEDESEDEPDDTAVMHPALSKEPVPIRVTTMLGQSVLDHALEMTLQRSGHVGKLKANLQRLLPGKPPVSTLQLKLGPRILTDDLLVDELMDDDEDEDDEDDDRADKVGLTLYLDMIPPVDTNGVESFTAKLEDLTHSQLLDAYVANEASLYMNAAMLLERDGENADGETLEGDNVEPQSTTVKSLAASTTLTLKHHAARIREELEAKLLQSDTAQTLLSDSIPPSKNVHTSQVDEILGQRVRRISPAGVSSSMRLAIQRNFNVDWAEVIKHVVLFLFFGYFGGRTPMSRALLYLGAPSVILLRARPVKIWLRRILYMLLSHPPSIMLSLLAAPQQAILNVREDQAMTAIYGEYFEAPVTTAEDLFVPQYDTEVEQLEGYDDDDVDSEQESDFESPALEL